MNKLFTKVVGLCLGLTMAVGVGTAVAFNGVHKEAVEAKAASGDVYTFTTTEGTSTDNQWSFATAKNSGSSGPAIASSQLRLYPKNTITFTGSSNVELTSASFSVAINKNKSGTYPTGWSVDNGSITSFTTSLTSFSVTNINASSFTITIAGSAGNVGLKTVTMVYTGGSTKTYDLTYVAGEHGTGSYPVSDVPAGPYTLLPFSSLTGVAADEGYRFSNYLVDSVSKNPGESITISGDTSVSVVFEEKPQGQTTYDFVEKFATYASGWSGYAERTLDGETDLCGDYAATIVLPYGSKQASTITTMPVVADQSAGDVVHILFTLEDDNFEINTVSVTFAKWGSKTPTMKLFKGAAASGTPLDSGVIGTKNTLSASNVGGAEFAVAMNDSSESRNQVGIQSITLTVKPAESFGTLDHIKVVSAPDKTTYHIGQTFDTTGLSVKAYDGVDEMTAHSKDVTESVTLSVTNGHEFVEADKSVSSVTVSYSESSISDTDTFGISVYGTKVYDKATSISEGNFIIVDSDGESGLVALAGYCEPLEQTGGKNAYAVSDSSGSITTGEEFEVSITSAGEENKYYIQLKNEKYLSSPTGSTSGIDASDTAVALTLTFDTDHFVLQGRNSKYFGFNSSADEKRFRFYKSGAGSTLQLYKEHQDAPEQHFELGGVMANNELYYDDYGVLTIGFKDPSQESLYPIVMASVVETDAPVDLDGEDKTYEYVTDDISGASATFTLSVYAYSSDYSSYLNEDIVVTIIKPAALVDAVDYAAAYLNAICDSGEMSSTDWAEAKDAYETILESGSQAYLLSADYTYESEGGVIVPTAKVGTHSTIAKAMYQYDYCLKKYSYENFMSRTPVYNIGYNVNPFFAVSGDNSSIAIIVVVSLLSVTAIGGYFFIRRRKEN